MNQTQRGKQSPAAVQDAPSGKGEQSFVLGLWGVRYQVKDVSRSIEFYYATTRFQTGSKKSASLRPGLNRQFQTDFEWSGASGSRPMPDGHTQEPVLLALRR